MIREKYKKYISMVSMGLATILTASAIVYSTSNKLGTTSTTVAAKNLSSVLDEDSVTDINIDISESDWNWLIENATNEEYKSCNITINGETYNNVGIRPKGNTSLTNVASDDTTDRYSFKIKFNEYVDGQTYNGMESIVLNNMIQDNTYMKEYITYDLYESLGVATPEMSYSNVKVNNETWGLYLALEVIDERYLENNFGTTEGNLYKPETMGVNHNGDNAGGDKGAGGNPPDMNGENKMGGMHQMQNQANPTDGAAPAMPQDGAAKEAAPSDTQGAANQSESPENQNPQNGESQVESADADAQNQNAIDAQGGAAHGGGPGGGRATEGADFIYIDDNVSSYSIVRDSAVLKSTTDEDFKNVINMYKNLNDGTNLEEVLDVEEVLKYFAVNTFVINLDSYSGAMYHNYYLYENNGKCQILPWDLNLSFAGYGAQGGHGGSSDSSTNMINFPIDNPVTGTLENMPLIGKLLEVDEYKELYHSYLKQIAEDYFNSGYYANLVNKIDNLINEYVKEDPTAFCTYDEYTTAVSEMINFGTDRTNSVLAQLSGEQPSTTYGSIESTVNISALGDMGGGMNKGDKENMNHMQMNNSETIDSTTASSETNPNGDTANGMMQQVQSENTNPAESNNQTNEQSNTNQDMNPNNGHMNNQKVGGNITNMAQNKTQSYLVLLGLTCAGILGTLFVSKFKRKKQ